MDASLQVIANLCHIKGSVIVGDALESTEKEDSTRRSATFFKKGALFAQVYRFA